MRFPSSWWHVRKRSDDKKSHLTALVIILIRVSGAAAAGTARAPLDHTYRAAESGSQSVMRSKSRVPVQTTLQMRRGRHIRLQGAATTLMDAIDVRAGSLQEFTKGEPNWVTHKPIDGQ
jgi:hypothetical protein